MATATAPSGFGRPIWNAIKGGNQVHGVGLVPVTSIFLGHSATFERILFTAPASATGGFWKIDAAQFVTEVEIAAHSSNTWTFMLQVGTLNAGGTAVAWTDLGNRGLTNDSDFSVLIEDDLPYSLDIDGPENAIPLLTYLAPGDSIKIVATGAGSPVDQSASRFTITMFMRHTPPGR